MSFSCNDYMIKEVMPPSFGETQLIDWGLHVIGAPLAWKKTKGEGMKVAVLDTGVDLSHPDLIDAIDLSADFTSSRRGAEDPNGHGTHVCGIIAGAGREVGVSGVAPGVKLYVAKVLDQAGGGTFDSIEAGLRWAIANKVDIINMSFGTADKPPEVIHQLIKEAHEKEIIMVAATGNENTEVCYPAAFDEVIAVSAVDQMLERAKFSNYGLQNEIAAPGVDITSTYAEGGYAKLSGTSMATPVVAGAIALYIADQLKESGIRPTLHQTHRALVENVTDLGEEGRDVEFGEGLVNLRRLLKIR